MAYSGTGSTAPNPPVMVFQAPAAFGRLAISTNSTVYGAGSSAVGGNFYAYLSTHTQATVGTSDFIGDGTNIGVRVADVFVVIATGGGVSIHRVTAVGSTFTSLSAGLLVSSAS